MNSARDPGDRQFLPRRVEERRPENLHAESLRVELGRHRNTLHAGSTGHELLRGPHQHPRAHHGRSRWRHLCGYGERSPSTTRLDTRCSRSREPSRRGASRQIEAMRAARARSACACPAAPAVGPSDSDLRRPRSRDVRQEEQVSFRRGARGLIIAQQCGHVVSVDQPALLCATRANVERGCARCERLVYSRDGCYELLAV